MKIFYLPIVEWRSCETGGCYSPRTQTHGTVVPGTLHYGEVTHRIRMNDDQNDDNDDEDDLTTDDDEPGN